MQCCDTRILRCLSPLKAYSKALNKRSKNEDLGHMQCCDSEVKALNKLEAAAKTKILVTCNAATARLKPARSYWKPGTGKIY
ncbi:hypothetical protein QE152_g6901 [Popillia japonica]|uniref:Uncharacterized protein n=1 Tax=Popillia japonica TaxID=7064 RepID=A0AAW1MGQ3_POPJA